MNFRLPSATRTIPAFLFYLAFSLFSLNSAQASHVPGAYFTYECVGANQYIITYNEIVRCSWGAPAATTSYSTTNDCSLTNLSLETLTLDTVYTLTQSCPSFLTTCDGAGSPEGFVLAVYLDTVTLPGACASWRFFKYSCCTYTVSNETAGQWFYYETEMNSAAEACNNSTYPLNPGAPNYFTNEQVLHNFNFVDPDGDSLVYSLVDSRETATTSRIYTSTYRGDSCIGNVQINSQTGEIAFNEGFIGLYIANIQIDEYRNGIQIGTTFYETFFTITSGVASNFAPENVGISNVSGATQVTSTQLSTCQSSAVSFDITFDDFNLVDVLSVTSNVATLFPGANITSSGTNPITATISFDASAATPGYYNIAIECKDDFCDYYKSTTAVIGMTVYPAVTFATTHTDITCLGEGDGSISGAVTGGTSPYYYWVNGVLQIGPTAATTYNEAGLQPGTYQLKASDVNGCYDFLNLVVREPLIIDPTIREKIDVTCNAGSDAEFSLDVVGGTIYCKGGPAYETYANLKGVKLVGETDSIVYTGACPGEVGVKERLDLEADLIAGNTYNLDLQEEGCNFIWAAFKWRTEAWIDWNSDGVFSASENLGNAVGSGSSLSLDTFTFGVPASASNGKLRLRVMHKMDFGLVPPLDPCESFNYGSVTDLTVSVSGGTSAFRGGYRYTIDGGINYQDSSTFTGLSSATYLVQILDSNDCEVVIPVVVNEPTQHIAQIDSSFDISCFGAADGEVFSSAYKFEPAYCNPVYQVRSCLYNDIVDDFTIDLGATNIFSKIGTGCPVTDTNYSDFTSDTITLIPGNTYDFTAKVGIYSQNIAVYIDYNRDGEFDDVNEFFSLGTAGAGGTTTASQLIPANAAGYTRMRIMTVYVSTVHNPLGHADYCKFIDGSIADAGEYEDYTVYFGNPFQFSLNGGSYQPSGSFTGVGPGAYTMDVQDNYGCIASSNGSISEPSELLSTIVAVQHETCETFSDGRILSGATGGTAISGSNPYLYEVVGPTPLGPQTSNIFENLSPGAYMLTVTDAENCVSNTAFNINVGNVAPSPFSTNLDTAYYKNHPDIGLYPIADPVPDLSITYSFGGDGIWSDSLHPGALAPGTYDAIYNYNDGSCQFTDSASFDILPANTNILIPGKTTPSNPWVFCAGDANTYTIVGLPQSQYGGNFVDTSSYVISTHIPPPPTLAGPFEDTLYAVLDNLELLTGDSYPIYFYSYVPVYSVDSVAGTSAFDHWDSVFVVQSLIIREIDPGTILGLEDDYCEGDSSGVLSVTGQNVSPTVPTGFAWDNTNGGFTGPSVGVDPIFYPDSIGSGDTTVVTYYVTDFQLYCSVSTSFYVNYHPKPAISFSGISDTVCSYFADTVLSMPSSGIFSNGIGLVSNVGVNAGEAVFDVNSGSSPSHWTTNLDYSWEYFPTCTVDSSMAITVMPDAATSFTVVDFIGDTIDAITPLEICHNDSVTYFANSLGAPVSNGYFPWDLTTIGQAPLIGFNTSSVAEITGYPFEYTYDDGINQCPYYDTLDVEVYPLPTVAIIGLSPEYCGDEPPASLTLLPNSNGILTFYDAFMIDTVSSAAPVLTPGSYANDTTFFVNYHYTDSLSSCSGDFLSTVSVHVAPNPFSSNIDTDYYNNHPDIGIYPIAAPIPDFSIAYSFAGDGVWSDSLHPSVLTPGTYSVIYKYIDGFCEFSDTSVFNINPSIDNVLIPSKTAPADPWIFCAGDANVYGIEGLPLSQYGGNFVNSAYVTATYIPPAATLAGPFEDTLLGTLSNLDALTAGQYPIEFYSYVPVYTVDTAAGTSAFLEWDSVLVVKMLTIRQINPGSILGLDQDYCEGEPGGLLSVSGQSVFPPVATSSQWTNTNGGFISPAATDPVFDPASIGAGDTTEVFYILSDIEGYCIDSASITVYYHPEPSISFTGITDTVCSYFADTVFCSPSVGVFSNGIGLVSNVGINAGSAVFDVNSDSTTHWFTNLDYSYEYFPNCTVDSSMTITIMPNATPSFTVVDLVGDTIIAIDPLEICHNDSVTYFANSLGAPVSNGYFSWDLTTVGQAPLIGANTSSVTEITEYPFVYVYDDGFNQCPYFDTLVVEVFPLPTIAILGLNTKYCSDEDSVALTLLPNSNGILTLSHDAMVDTLSSAAPYLNPGVYISDTAFFMNYHYTDSLSGCSNDFLAPINIYEAPIADFYIIDSCAMNPTTFISTSLGNATSFIWDLDDGGLASGDTVAYTYPEPGIQVIILYASSNNCSNILVDSVNIGNTPLPDFTYAYGCYDQSGIHANAPALFYDASTANSGPAIGYWFWDFGDLGTLADTSLLDTTSYAYQAAAAFDVSLYVENVYGCGDTITKQLIVQPYYNLMDTIVMPFGYQKVYFDNLEGATPEWLIDDIAGVNSTWELGTPSAVIDSPYSGTNSYVTSLSGSYSDDEASYVYGPCFDLNRLKRPMIKLKTWSDVIDYGSLFGSNDGARLEYWTGTSGWTTIGNTKDGINWYNADSIYSGSPAGPHDFLGWSGQDTSWMDSRYKLDEIRNGTDSDTLVRFRIAFHADDLLAGGGFAFDDVWIGERKKRVLVEHFTNTEDAPSVALQGQFDAMMQANELDAIDLQYHTENPSGDLLWADYPSGPNARTLYYSVGSILPYSINDGNVYRDSTHNWLADSAVFKGNSLLDPGFKVDLTGTTINATSREVDVRVKLQALKDYIGENIRVHIAVIEKNAGVSGSRNVVRQMLPDAGGAILPVTNMYTDDTLSMAAQTWSVPVAMDISNIMVVAFVQNYTTQEVYQCADNLNFLIATDEIEQGESSSFLIFPNPVKYEATVVFDKPIEESYTLEVFNSIGQKMDHMIVKKGASQARLNFAHYRGGVYIVRVIAKDRVVGWSSMIKQ